ncbi:MAG: DUF438 domain-containing protein [Bryobacterales bacterium]|nr:DUF438 domain-containing protein [Bryobacterales bacterium]
MSETIDNRANRARTLKSVVRELLQGVPPEEVKAKLRDLAQRADYSEILSMERELIDSGMPAAGIQAMCDLHSQVTRDVLAQRAPEPLPPGHPIDTFRRENAALRDRLLQFRTHMDSVAGDGGEAAILAWRQTLHELMDVDKHYRRKERLLFRYLERHGISGPSKARTGPAGPPLEVMHRKDDEILEQLKNLTEALPHAGVEDARLLAANAGESAAGAMEEMIFMEENILFPACLDTFTEDEWAEIWKASLHGGWCLVEPREGYRPTAQAPAGPVPPAVNEGVQLPTGRLSVAQLAALFATLPVDITFVDADDRVAFFSEGPGRIFSRTNAILGRKVHHCHPPGSLDVVDRILDDFRSGRQSVAEFWMRFMGRMVHTRFLAVRDGAGAYLGALEVTQDIGPIQRLSGERRLLEYEKDASREEGKNSIDAGN